MTTALRSFLQYARMRGEITLDLGAAVPIVANWSMTSIPRAIAAEQTQELLASIDRKTAMGRRDYAILLVLARLGLRAGEVMSLELDDIDWSTGELTVHGKGRRSQLPLTPDVGKAIAAYCELPVSVFDAKFRGAKSLGWWVRTGAALGKRGLVVPRHPIGRVRGEGGGVAL
jgi:site-specific recombinase XerC